MEPLARLRWPVALSIAAALVTIGMKGTAYALTGSVGLLTDALESVVNLLAAVTAQDGSPHDVAYFWLTGVLSEFLDNAPTYLVFFELAGGDAKALMGPLASTLAAISMGAVYMGAMTYIGNAPNLMVYAIAVERGVKMPSFFGYMVWAAAALLPVLALISFASSAKLW